MQRKIQQILPPPPPHMVGDGFRVHNFFPSGYNMGERRMSPFFLMDYNSKIEFPPTEKQRGVGVHPHKGFETVTIAFHGKIAHHDSYGNSGIIGEGEVQWMTAGSGLLHKEYHEKEFSRKGGMFQMVQLWVNLPSKFKNVEPSYQPISSSQMGKHQIPEDGGTVEVIAGNFKDVKGPARTYSPIELYVIKMNKNASLNYDLPEDFNSGILVVDGSAVINGETAPADNFVLFDNKGESIEIKTEEPAVLLVLSGEPINEPIVAYGPFLMNSKQEILQDYDDFHKGKFGVLED